MTPDALMQKIRAMCAVAPHNQVAERLGISPQLMCDLMKGRREPGPKVLEALGLVKKVTYVKGKRRKRLTRVRSRA